MWNDDDVEQLFGSIMARTSYISMKWWWCGTTFQLYHGENQLHFNEMMMWSNFSALSWREQVTFQWNDDDVEQLFSSIMARTSYISMKWWWCGATFQPYHGENNYISMKWWWCRPCTRPTSLVGLYSASSLKQQSAGRHITPFGHIYRIYQSLLST